MRRPLAVAGAFLLAACGEDFAPYTLVDKLRVLGVRAEPPMLRPGERASLKALVVDPRDRSRKVGVIWIACDPDPLSLESVRCARFETLQRPEEFLAGCLTDGCPARQRCDLETRACVEGCTSTKCVSPRRECVKRCTQEVCRDVPYTCNPITETCVPDTGQPVPGVRPAGFNQTAAYIAPRDVFDPLCPDASQRVRGLNATIFGIVFGAELPFPPETNDIRDAVERAQLPEDDPRHIDSVLFLKRIPIIDFPAENRPTAPNANPVLQGIVASATFTEPAAAIPRALPGERVKLEPAFAAGSDQCFYTVDPQGEPVQEVPCTVDGSSFLGKRERLIAVWFSTAGTFNDGRTALDFESGSFNPETFAAPDGSNRWPISADRFESWWVVLQDGRGGASWTERPVFVCDPTRPTPQIRSVEPIAPVPGARIVLRGTDLDQILDVTVGARVVPGSYDPASGGWVGTLPADTPAPTTQPLRARAKSCGDGSWDLPVP